MNVCYWLILLKKSAKIFTVEKYVFEIGIFTLNKGFRAQIRVAARKKGAFSIRCADGLEGPTVFDRVGQKQSLSIYQSGAGHQPIQEQNYVSLSSFMVRG